VNEQGQVVGVSYTNSIPNATTGLPTLDPFLWDKGTMIDLGTLGGTFGSAFVLNNRGDVVGTSNLAGDQTSHPFLWRHGKLVDLFTTTTGGSPITANQINESGEIVGAAAFPNRPFDAYLWKNGVATDLGTLNGDCFSEAVALNSGGQVVGSSIACDFSSSRSFLWENGSMVDLNTLIPPNSGLELVETIAINDHGEIAGDADHPGCGISDALCGHAYVLIPNGDCDSDCEGRIAASQNTRASAQNLSMMKQRSESPSSRANQLRNRLMPRYGIHGQAAAPRD
jgi:probable HAF family extracellular repeat protein